MVGESRIGIMCSIERLLLHQAMASGIASVPCFHAGPGRGHKRQRSESPLPSLEVGELRPHLPPPCQMPSEVVDVLQWPDPARSYLELPGCRTADAVAQAAPTLDMAQAWG